jgi:hypothetical protein
MYKVKFVDPQGKKQTIIMDERQVWITFGNFSGMGKFSKLKISQITDENNLEG